METGGEAGFFFVAIDNNKRHEDLNIVRQAEGVEALFIASHQHFDASISSISADRLLQEFDDQQLDPVLAVTEGFDPLLFKAVVLFELTHLKEDESLIPFIVKRFSNLWSNTGNHNKADFERWFTADTKRSNYVPFAAMAEYVTHSISGYVIHQQFERMKAETSTEPEPDPLQKEIDGDNRPWRVSIGGHEIKASQDHPVLTRQLTKDLHKLYPSAIIKELEYRFPDEGQFEDVQPLIERIKFERSEGIMPPAQELLSGFRRQRRRMQAMFGQMDWDIEDNDVKAQLKMALKDLKEHHRNIGNRIGKREVYALETNQWFTIHQLESDTERDVYYRRIYYGDMITNLDKKPRDQLEVPIEARGPIIEELRLEQERVASETMPYEYWYNPLQVQDVFGSFEPSETKESSRNLNTDK